jgi:membrane glycosyltransferase
MPGKKSMPEISVLPRRPRGWRVFFFYSCALLPTGLVSLLFADLLWRTGWSTSRTVLLVLFVILFLFAAIGCVHGVFGFFLRRFGDRRRITCPENFRAEKIDGISTAIIFPVYNESVVRVYEGLRATYESLERTGQLERFDFFILSDSTQADNWVEEERRWYDLIRELDALGRIYYRRRLANTASKSGNVRDFLNTWGRRYRYFIVADADSVLRGETLVDLVKLMETHPAVGLIQTVPALVNAESLFGRIQQFANRLYAPVFIAGLNYWSQGFGNYWGHNAIIRTEPFMQFCDLPHLPGRKPFGGQILSHDFVEAALLLRDNWQVWFAYDLEGSYEEAPQALTDNAQRERRWCQGNLQHTLVLFTKGLRGVSRLHLILGISGYVAGPLWLAFLLTFDWMRWFHNFTGLSELPPVSAWNPYLRGLSATAHAFLIFCICMFVIMLPKALALIDLAYDWKRRKIFGGLARTTAGVLWETIFSTLHAPMLMLWHTRFVLTNLVGASVGWTTQKRDADGTTWTYALARHWGHLLIGLVWGYFMWQLDPSMFWWFTPVLAGMVLSLPLSVFTSRRTIGLRARSLGLFLTPEETAPPPEIVSLRARMKIHELTDDARRRTHGGVADAVLDPYINAIHVSLAREKLMNPVYAEEGVKLGVGSERARQLGEKLLVEGPDKLTTAERMLVLADQTVMVRLHQQAWQRSGEALAPWWRAAILEYRRRD